VRVAFFLRNSALDRVIAFYPGPGGATESELPMDAWDDLLASTRLARELTPDVEALLVDRGDGSSGGPTCLLVPVDVCYELVGRLRLRWAGFDGGEEARADLAAFLDDARGRSRALAPAAE
jgi:Family of unknown function (DUF5947)